MKTFLLVFLLVQSSLAYEYFEDPMTPDKFRAALKTIKSAKKDDHIFFEYSAVEYSEDEAAKCFLQGKADRKSKEFADAQTSFGRARAILEELQTKEGFKARYPLTIADIRREQIQTLEDIYQSHPLIDEKAMRAVVKRKGRITLEFDNGRPYVEDELSKRYKVTSMQKFCASARFVFPRRTYLVDGVPLILEFLRATYGPKTLYDFCSEKLLRKAQKRYRESGDYPEVDSDTPGMSLEEWAEPKSLVGPLFSYSEFLRSVESRVNYWQRLVTLDLRKGKPAKFDDWFEAKSLSAPCPSQAILDHSNKGYMHCHYGGELQRNAFVFHNTGNPVELSFFVENFSQGRPNYYSFSKGSGNPSKALREIFKTLTTQNSFFERPEE